ncbi:MAG TPA: alpha/beta fold hydrolase [Kribbella sp.]|nr:alpha/beta fold hydrolase [Kribbella sp.]
MTVDTSNTGRSTAAEISVVPRAPRQIRLVLGSLTTGALTALVLTLVVFPGATEPVITGSVLLAFGLGWAMLAMLSTRMTGQSHRWAWVPAAAMSITGALLVAFSPQDATMSALNWVWPPAALVLAVWTWRRMRRSLRRAGRWLLTPVLVGLALAAIGATVEDITAVRLHHDYPAPGPTYTVGDHRLHIECRGHGGPTVVLFNGLGEISASWSRITEQVSTTTRVCAYDRAGQGWSTDTTGPQDGITAAGDLHTLLATAGESGPYVLVGHSIGGPYAMTYAQQYPEDVAGMVLLDSSSPRQLTDIPDYAWQYQLMRRGLAFLPTLARLGLGGVITPGSHLPGDAGEVVHAMTSTPRAERNGRDEVSMIPVVFKQAQQLTTLGARPLAVLTASESLSTDGWAEAQDRLAGLSSNSLHRDVESTHPGLLEDPDGSNASVAAIKAVVAALSSGARIASS